MDTQTNNIPGLPAGATLGAAVNQPTSVSDQSQPVAGLPPGATVGDPVQQATPVANAPAMGDDTTPLDNFMTGAGHSLAQTANGALGFVEKLGNPSGDPNNERQWFKDTRNYLSANSTNTGTGAAGIEQGLGSGAEDIAEFLLGDETLKGFSVAKRLNAVGKLADAIESSPRLNRLVQLGIRAVRGATVGGIQGGLKTGDATDATLSGIGAGVGNAILPEISTIVTKDIPAAFNLKAVQSVLQKGVDAAQGDFHDSLRGILSSVADDAGVKPAASDSLRDTAANVAQAVKAKASALYKQLDQAIGGTRFQTYDEQLSNVKRALRNSAGIDPDADGRLVERINDLEDAKAAAMEQAKANGVDPNLINQANAAYRQGSALEDLSKHIRASASGLRPELSTGDPAASEAISPAKLATRANRLYDSGRLQQALGDDRADDLLRATEQTKQHLTNLQQAAEQRAQQIQRNWKVAGSVAGGALGAGGVVSLLSHLLGH